MKIRPWMSSEHTAVHGEREIEGSKPNRPQERRSVRSPLATTAVAPATASELRLRSQVSEKRDERTARPAGSRGAIVNHRVARGGINRTPAMLDARQNASRFSTPPASRPVLATS